MRYSLALVFVLAIVAECTADANARQLRGCFALDSLVTMADGSQQAIADIQAGDSVRSWDAASNASAIATVVDIPKFKRDAVIELELESGALIISTPDHPFYSQRRHGMVSRDPKATTAQYGFDVEWLEDEEIFENEDGEAVKGRIKASRRASVVLVDGAELVESFAVATLCLSEHHWFYVRGVRVHNKGCFALDTKVTMADGERKAIAEILPGDHVMSWDARTRSSVNALVLDAPRYRSGGLMKLELETGLTLLSTVDHPYFSHRRQMAVSRDPNATKESYGMDVEWLEDVEVFVDERGQPIKGKVGSYSSAPTVITDGVETFEPFVVATLNLAEHHWFYAHGVRVHNKGFHGGGGYGGFHGHAGYHAHAAGHHYAGTSRFFVGNHLHWIIPAAWLLRTRRSSGEQCWVTNEEEIKNHSSCAACQNLTCVHERGPGCVTWLNRTIICGVPPTDDSGESYAWIGALIIIIPLLIFAVKKWQESSEPWQGSQSQYQAVPTGVAGKKMTEDEAAVKIQSFRRGQLVRRDTRSMIGGDTFN